MDCIYEPGEIKVTAYDESGNAAEEKAVKTAGKSHSLKLEADRSVIKADGKDISFITVYAVDKNGVFCPLADNTLSFRVSGSGSFRAACSGDAASLELFHNAKMRLFSGQLVVLIQSAKKAGEIRLEVSGEGLKTSSIVINAV